MLPVKNAWNSTTTKWTAILPPPPVTSTTRISNSALPTSIANHRNRLTNRPRWRICRRVRSKRRRRCWSARRASSSSRRHSVLNTYRKVRTSITKTASPASAATPCTILRRHPWATWRAAVFSIRSRPPTDSYKRTRTPAWNCRTWPAHCPLARWVDRGVRARWFPPHRPAWAATDYRLCPSPIRHYHRVRTHNLHNTTPWWTRHSPLDLWCKPRFCDIS